MMRPASARAIPVQSFTLWGLRIFALRPDQIAAGSDYAEQFLPRAELEKAA